MAAGDVKVGSIFAEIRAKLDSYDKDLKDARKMTEQQIGGLQKSIDKISFEKAGASVMDFAKKAVAALAIYKAVDFTKGAVMAAARFETLGVVLDTIGKSTKYSAAEIKGFEEQLRNTGIAGLEARQVLTQMIQSNLDLGKSAELARVAQDAAVISNLNSSETLQRMTHAIQANSVEILRTLGMNVSFEAATQKLAKSLGTTTEGLSEQQKVMARMNAVIEGGIQIAGAYEAAMSTAAKQIKSFERYVSDFEVEFGKAFNPALTAIIFGASEALKKLTEAVKDPAFQRSIETLAEQLGTNIVNAMNYIVSNQQAVLSFFTNTASGVKQTVEVFNSIPSELTGPVGYGIVGRMLFGGWGPAKIIAVLAAINEGMKFTGTDIGGLGEKHLAAVSASKEFGKSFVEVLSGERHWWTGEYVQWMKAADTATDFWQKHKKGAQEYQSDIKGILESDPLGDFFERHKRGMDSFMALSSKLSGEISKEEKEAKAKAESEKARGPSVRLKFAEEYAKEFEGEAEYQRLKLKEQYDDFNKHVTDKLILLKWYVRKKEEILLKEYTDSNEFQSLKTSGFIRPEENEAKRFLQDPRTSRENAAKYQASQEDTRTQNEKDVAWAAEYQQKALEDTKRDMEIFNDTMNVMSQTAADAFAGFVTGTKSAKVAFQEMVQSMISGLVRLSTQKLTEQLFGMIMKGAAAYAGGGGGGIYGTGPGGGLEDPYGHAHGAAFGPAGRYAFAKGGVVRKPTMFRFSGGTGLMGEAGPEGILPLKRNSKGDLGVSVSKSDNSSNVAKQAEPPQVHMHFYPNSQGQYDRESVSEAQARLYSSISRANQRNR